MKQKKLAWPANKRGRAFCVKRSLTVMTVLTGFCSVMHTSVGYAENTILPPIQLLLQKQLPDLDYGHEGELLKSELDHFYAQRQYKPAWIEKGKPKPIAILALAVLTQSDTEGLNPKDYAVDRLAQQIRQANPIFSSAKEAVYFDSVISQAWLRYGHDVHEGRIASPYKSSSISAGEAWNAVEWLQRSVTANTLAQRIEEAEPRWPLYQMLKEVLARYRKIEHSEWLPLTALKPSQRIHPSEPYPELMRLYERLLSLGDVSPSLSPLPIQETLYTGDIVQGVQRFQARHALIPDGILNAATIDALNQPISHRIQQIELSMERLRWMSLADPEKPFIIVNIPSFHLMGFSDIKHVKPVLTMKVIVGTAVKTPTPLLSSQMQSIQFNPYWNVPQSILRKEILPQVEKNASYLRRKDFEIVGHDEEDGSSDDVMQALQQGHLRIRQRPGRKNPLGRIKFIIPNPMDIYLHATPGASLFQRTRRDFSHGCIRVEHPVALAEWVLNQPTQWSAQRIQEAMSASKTRHVTLSSPVPVFLSYYSASVNEVGQPVFFKDIYGEDARLIKALNDREIKWINP
jgi:L,D-transpeptidase YcbB